MPKKTKEIAAAQLPRLPVGMHAAGGATGLYLRVAPSGARNWILRVTVGNRRRDMGLGGWPDVPLAEARDRARQARRKIEEGIDPIEARRAAKTVLRETPSFSECARRTIEAKRPEWKSAKHAEQWKSTLDTYAKPVVGNMPVDQVELRHVVEILSPIWIEKTETATRLRARLEAVLAWAGASGFRKGENPARWRGNLDAVLAKPGKVAKVEHHRALPLSQLSAFVAQLRKREGASARALEFLILTATRSGEVRGATWEEIDLKENVWTIPASRMKAGKEHRVPLTARTVALLKKLPRFAHTPLLFPAERGGMLSDMALTALMRRMDVDAVPHGFRSTFRDWAAEHTEYPRDVAEMALAHTIGDKVEAAYRRGDLFSKRTAMMADWAKFAAGGKK
ncbi:integrase arm-type DNA-binding domain-containing protein [Pseudoxanthomonas helianthi]|uniref:Integrase arm-type DNA-binding domain-containing protein n=1 Tax=Pseudoxanthomonas helianthi TaxID=1453541 RepID=A0A940X498_9GAMM|nr:site-specific integrase [Pseudoxanthomonas helianthi]MBP3985763.1 integrase arm-type DNA-binding domain-containing protein [Pseudoxanthomonas helianthi]